MSNDFFLPELYALWDKLKTLFASLLDAPTILRAWSEGRASVGERVSLVAAVVIIVATVAWIVRFFKAGFLRKLGMLLGAAVVIFAAAIVLSFFSTAEDAARPTDAPAGESPAPAVSVPAGTQSGTETPGGAEAAAETPAVSVPATPIPRTGGQYSLARGAEDPLNPGRVGEMWRLGDDAVSWQIDDSLVLQLSSIHSLPGVGRFAVEEMVSYSDHVVVSLRRREGGETDGALRRSECVLEITIWPGAKIERMPWYAEAPSYISTGEQEGYSVFENTGSEVRFLQKDAKVTNADGDAVLALCMARRVDSDVVLVSARAFTTLTDGDMVEYTDLNPGADEELKSRLTELERAIFDGRLRLLRNLGEEGLASVLPGRIVDFPVGESNGRGNFSIPCTRLLEMRRSEGLGAVIRFIGPGPNGGEMLYSLVSGAALYENVRTNRYFTWREGYEKGWLDPDAEMTAFLGCPAVECDGGWVLDPGSFYSPSTDSTMENYYFLGAEVLTPAPTPVPTPEPTPEAAEGETSNG